MKQEFEAQAYDSTCNFIGEAYWQLVLADESVMPDTITDMIIQL